MMPPGVIVSPPSRPAEGPRPSLVALTMRGRHPSRIGLLVTDHRMRPVRLLERSQLFWRQLDFDGLDQLLQMIRLGRTDNRRRNAGRLHDPRACDLCRRDFALLRYIRYRRGDFQVALLIVQALAELVGLRPLGRRPAVAGPAAVRKKSTRKRTPRNQPDALIDAQWIHLALFLAINEIVMILHRDEPMPAVFLGRVQRFGKLPRRHAAGAQVEYLARTNEGVERVERLFEGRREI